MERCVSVPELQSVFQQVNVRRLGNVGAQLDDGQQERVEVLTLCPQALEEHTTYVKSIIPDGSWQRIQRAGFTAE